MDHLIKSTNERLVLDIILEDKEVTKKDIAFITRLSFPTVSKIIDDMEVHNQVVMLGHSKSVNGRKAAIYRLNPNYGKILSLYFQHEYFSVFLGNMSKEILSIKEMTLRNESYLKTIYEIIEEYVSVYTDIKVISIGIPGGVLGGTIKYIAYYEELQEVPLEKLITDRFRIPCVIERDVNVMAQSLQSEYKYPKEDTISLLFLTREGPGSASIVQGNLLRGNVAFAGEVGYLPLYDETNIQDVTTKNTYQKNKQDAIAKLITTLCICINPKKLVIIQNEKEIVEIEETIERVTTMIPSFVLPDIEVINDYHPIYQIGLLQLGRNKVFHIS